MSDYSLPAQFPVILESKVCMQKEITELEKHYQLKYFGYLDTEKTPAKFRPPKKLTGHQLKKQLISKILRESRELHGQSTQDHSLPLSNKDKGNHINKKKAKVETISQKELDFLESRQTQDFPSQDFPLPTLNI
jgi:hypothetical protein